jgi:dTDP-4-dehydrorhamnose reductase
MPEVTTDFLKKVVTLAESAGQLEKKADAIKEAAPAAVDALISSGLIVQEKRDAWIKKLASDPTCWLDTLKKVAAQVSTRSMGASESQSKTEEPKSIADRNSASDRFFVEKFCRR